MSEKSAVDPADPPGAKGIYLARGQGYIIKQGVQLHPEFARDVPERRASTNYFRKFIC